ncbi:MAG: FHA domain-containing protein [Myxococcota bacterium]
MELVWEEDGQEQSIDIGPDRPEVLLGRHQDCDIRVQRPSVSRRHALFSWTNGGVVVTDQGSTAGTFIDGNKITKARVQVGQVVNAGGIMVLLDAGVAQPAAKPAAPGRKTVDDFQDIGKSRREESTAGGRPAAQSGAGGGKKEVDLDKLFDDPPVRRRGAAGKDEPEPARKGAAPAAKAAPPPAKKAGFDANDFFKSGGDDEDDGFDAPPPEPVRRRGDDAGDKGKAAAAPAKAAAAAPAPKVSAKANLACYLLYIDDDGADAEVRVERDGEPLLIGRREPAVIKVHNASVSGKHCTVGWQDEEVVVRDLGSSNGTFINGERVRRGVLNDGDVLRCGRFELRASFVEHKDIAQAEYEEWGDDWEDDELDPGQPNFHIIYQDNRGQLTGVTMGEKEKHLAVGSRGCEINIEKREVEPEHCEFEWDDGILVVKDLKSESGTFVNDNQVEGDESVRNADVVVVGTCRLRVVRGTSDDWEPPPAEKRSEKADVWARHLDNRDDDLEILFIDGELDDGSGRHELSLWGNGEARIEVNQDGAKRTATGQLDRDLRKILYDAILKSGFPDAKPVKNRAGEVPAELHLFQGRDEAKITMSKKLTQRSPAYHEVLELLRSIAHELAAD